MGFSKYSLLLLLALAFMAALWVFGRSVFTGVTKWLLWAFAACLIKVTESLRKKS